MTGTYKIWGYFAAGVRVGIPVLALPISAARSIRTVVVSVVINRNTIGIGNSSLTTRASGKPAAKAFGMIVGNQCVKNLEAR